MCIGRFVCSVFPEAFRAVVCGENMYGAFNGDLCARVFNFDFWVGKS